MAENVKANSCLAPLLLSIETDGPWLVQPSDLAAVLVQFAKNSEPMECRSDRRFGEGQATGGVFALTLTISEIVRVDFGWFLVLILLGLILRDTTP